MFTKSNLLATLAGFLTLYLLGWIFYGMVADDFFMQHAILQGVHKKESMDGIWQIATGSILISFFMATIYNRWSTGMHSISQGFQFGALIGAMIGLGLGMIMYATSNFMDFTGQLVDGVWCILYYGITGMVISWIYKATAKE